jgi:hypothetical protein
LHGIQTRKPKSKKRNRNSARAAEAATVFLSRPSAANSEVPAREAFLEEAKNEQKRKLISDHILTIRMLRDDKSFTFRGIAEWLTKRGVEADHSAVYRAYVAAIPEGDRDPRESWDDVEPD